MWNRTSLTVIVSSIALSSLTLHRECEAQSSSGATLPPLRHFEPGTVKVSVAPAPDCLGSQEVQIEVQESNVGQFNFGVAVGDDRGVVGRIGTITRNFDITEVPAKKIKIGVSIPAADHGWTAGIGWWAKRAMALYPDAEFI